MAKFDHPSKRGKGRNKQLFMSSCVFYIFLAGINVAFALLLQSIIDAAAEGNVDALRTAVIQAVIITVLEFAAAYFSKLLGFSYVESMLTKIKNNRLRFLFQGRIFNKDSEPKHNLSNFTTDVDLLGSQYFVNKVQVVYYISQFAFSLSAIVYINWILSIIIIAVSLLPFIIPSLFQKYVRRATDNYSKTAAAYTEFVNECLAGELDIIAYGRDSEVFDKHTVMNKRIERARKKARVATNLAGIISNSLGTFAFLTVISVSAYFVMTDKMTFGYMIAVIQLMNGLLGPVGQLINSITAMSSVKGVRTEMIRKRDDETGGADIDHFLSDIKIQNLSFTYNNALGNDTALENDALKCIFNDLNLVLKKGGKYALTGPSGSGKSTLAKIIAGEIASYDGTVKLDDRDIRSVKPPSYMRTVRYLRQEPFLFNDSIKSNIIFNDGLDTPDQNNRFDTAVSLSNVKEFTLSDTEMSRGITNATGISGGQKQRIALARALYHDFDVLILDEALSGVGVEQGQEILTNIFRNFKDKTFIVISHHNDSGFLSLFDEVINLKTM